MKAKSISIFLSAMFIALTASADEGMWLVNGIDRQLYGRMRREGLRLRPEALYGGEASIADAVVAVDGGMGTGSMVSADGLMITNHHVAYGDICALGDDKHDYLEDGFWASSRAGELPVKGKSVWFLRGVVDVTDEIAAERERMRQNGKTGVMGNRRLFAMIEKRYSEQSGYEASCVSMWNGLAYYVYLYDVYRDVRLVAAPPVRIGAFGGNADNWNWPQHKGDFAIYRVYCSRDGRPAEYSADNVPLHPRRWLEISDRGVREGDFTMVVGYPGRTHRYMSSFAVGEKQNVRNPVIVEARHARMEIIDGAMRADSAVRRAYSDRYFNLSNYADYAQWENNCFRRFGVAGIRAGEETRMHEWICSDSVRRAKYGDLLESLGKAYAIRAEAVRERSWFQEAWISPSEALLVANRVSSMLARLRRENVSVLDPSCPEVRKLAFNRSKLGDNYDRGTDRRLFVKLVGMFTENVPRRMWGEYLNAEYDRFGGDAEAMAAAAFDASFCSDAGRYADYFSQRRTVDETAADPMVALAASVSVMRFVQGVRAAGRAEGLDADSLDRVYARLLHDFRQAEGVCQYPDANSTMRLSYGHVRALEPRDGVSCNWFSTAAGILEKASDDYDYRVDDTLRAIIADEGDGMVVNFITDNDITGGNSGSPVLDGRGRIVGLAFDGNRESMAGDVWFNGDHARTVCVDIRYVMTLIERYAPSDYLYRELSGR